MDLASPRAREKKRKEKKAVSAGKLEAGSLLLRRQVSCSYCDYYSFYYYHYHYHYYITILLLRLRVS